jgi:nucleoside-diphosphate-sugar epimerase
MRILIVGGTRFVGRAIAEAALAGGHDVTLLHRGKTMPQSLAEAEHILVDRDGDQLVDALAGRTFDATVDVCAYVPRQVTTLAAALDGRGGHQVFISTMSVYVDEQDFGFDESGRLATLSDPTTEDVTNETYGGLKVLCEQAAVAAYGDDAVALVRPTYVIGPHDPTGRFTWWVRRIADGGRVLAPGPHEAPMQVIDARDQGEWCVRLAESAATGPFNSVAPTPPFGFGHLLDAAVRAVGPHSAELVWVDGGWLREQGEDGQTLPLWTEGVSENVMAADPTRALNTGLSPRPLTETVADTLAWMKDENPAPAPGWGLSAEREAELLALWDARG